MTKSVEIPQDIIDNVIAAVGDDTDLLKQCTLVSSSFLLPSRKQLFSRIILENDETCQGIHQFLIQNPVIQSYVRAITLTGPRNTDWMNGTSLPAILQLPFCCLECFSIAPRGYFFPRKSWDWNGFSSELKDALSNIIHSSNLKTLSIKGVTNVPITFFLHIVHLTTLELRYVSPDDFRYDNSSSLTPAASKGVAPTPSHAVIDRCMWSFEEENGCDSTRSLFLPFICRLRFFEISVHLGSATIYDFDILAFLMGSLSISLTSPSTLEHLEFDISFEGSDNGFDHYEFYENLRDADAWTHLDSISTHPTGSRLQRVDINIDYAFRYDDNMSEPNKDEVMEAVLDGLPLLRTKGILFVKAVMSR